jgi:hypothetical protein
MVKKGNGQQTENCLLITFHPSFRVHWWVAGFTLAHSLWTIVIFHLFSTPFIRPQLAVHRSINPLALPFFMCANEYMKDMNFHPSRGWVTCVFIHWHEGFVITLKPLDNKVMVSNHRQVGGLLGFSSIDMRVMLSFSNPLDKRSLVT